MSRRSFPRITALALSAALMLPMSAQALTRDQAAELLEKVYVDPVDPEVLSAPTIQEMLEALGDPYTQYFTPEQYDSFINSLSDTSVVGVGVVCQKGELGLNVIQVFEGAPAWMGGLQPGDVITQVEATPLADHSLEDASALLRGKAGTQVTITWLREGRSHTNRFTRDRVTVPTVTTRVVDGHIGLITCTSFGLETADHMRESIRRYDSQVDAWIVDLRGNTGGYVSTAADAAACFAGPGQTALLRDGRDNFGAVSSQQEGLTLYPAIILTDAVSASASELFSSSLRDRKAGIVVGGRTFGKGTVQSVLDQDSFPDYFPDGDAIKISSNRYFSPAGNTTDQLGVLPDLAVDPRIALDVARLLASADPAGDTSHFLRLAMDWRWSIDLDLGLTQELRPALTALLSALAPDADLMRGIGGNDGWEAITPAQAAAELGLALEARTFPDAADSPYDDAIHTLAVHRLVGGDESGLFHPADFLTRAELAQLLASAMGCFVPHQPSPFTDVAEDAWYKDSVTALTRLGILNGVGGGRFDPEGTVDHSQFITVMGRVAAWMNLNFYLSAKLMEPADLKGSGLHAYPAWARPQVWLMTASQKGLLGNTVNLLWAPLDLIEPAAPTTREEAAFTLCRLLTFTGVLPS